MEWIDKLKDMLKIHIFNGLEETYYGVNRLTNGQNTLKGFQIALNGIENVQPKKLQDDYEALMKTLTKNNYDENTLEQAIKNAYYSYAKNALQNAGLNCDSMNLNLIQVPTGMEFVHAVYINTAREIWMQPHLFSHKYPANIRLENQRNTLIIIDGAIEFTVRDGVDLNKIITAYQTGVFPRMPVRKVREPTLKEKFHTLNHNKTLLDDETEVNDEDDLVIQAVHSINSPKSYSVHNNQPPPTPSTMGGITIDNEEHSFGLDSQTIQSSPEPEHLKFKISLPVDSSNDTTDSSIETVQPGSIPKRLRSISVKLSKPVPVAKGDAYVDVDVEESEQLGGERTTHSNSKPSSRQITASDDLANIAQESETVITPVTETTNTGTDTKTNGNDIVEIKKDASPIPDAEVGDEVMKIRLDPGTKYHPIVQSSMKIIRRGEPQSDAVSVYSEESSDSGESVATASTVLQKPSKKLPKSVLRKIIPFEIIEDTGVSDNIMIKNSSNRTVEKSIIDMTEDIENQPVMTIHVDDISQKRETSTMSVKLLDEDDALSSRLSILRSRKKSIRSLGTKK
jgi:hypothetical protein